MRALTQASFEKDRLHRSETALRDGGMSSQDEVAAGLLVEPIDDLGQGLLVEREQRRGGDLPELVRREDQVEAIEQGSLLVFRRESVHGCSPRPSPRAPRGH
jgi:hypothetical protein